MDKKRVTVMKTAVTREEVKALADENGWINADDLTALFEGRRPVRHGATRRARKPVALSKGRVGR